MWPEVKIKSSLIFPIVAQKESIEVLNWKVAFLKIAPKVTQYLSYFLKKICSQYLSKNRPIWTHWLPTRTSVARVSLPLSSARSFTLMPHYIFSLSLSFTSLTLRDSKILGPWCYDDANDRKGEMDNYQYTEREINSLCRVVKWIVITSKQSTR